MDGFMAETLTKEDIKKIEAEIEERKLVLRPQLIEAVKEARAHGDLSENFEYYAAKREKNKNESRINYLERMLRFCNVYEDKTEDDQVGIDKVVELYFEEDDGTCTRRHYFFFDTSYLFYSLLRIVLYTDEYAYRHLCFTCLDCAYSLSRLGIAYAQRVADRRRYSFINRYCGRICGQNIHRSETKTPLSYHRNHWR